LLSRTATRSVSAAWTWALVGVILLAGALIRFYDLTDLPFDFHPARQFHSAIIARGLYTRWGGEYPDWQASLNIAQESSEARIEPPILEYLVAFTFKLTASDNLWIARVYSILFWLAGGLGLFMLVRRLVSTAGAVIALGYYLLLPYGVIASRTFQPDPLMVSLSIFALWAMVNWFEHRDWKWTVIAGLLSGAAILVKQVAVFWIFAALAGLVLSGWGFKKTIKSGQFWALAGLAAGPVVIYTLYGVFIQGSLTGQFSQRFFPELYFDAGFYIRWSQKIAQTTGIVLLLVSLVGGLALRRRYQRGLFFGLFAGYLVYGFVFPHHISTHDYYSLILIPIVALGLGALAELVLTEIKRISPLPFTALTLSAVLIGASLLSIYDARSTLKKVNDRGQASEIQQLAQTMGGPNTPTIGLSTDYGAGFAYYGYILPTFWEADENGVSLQSLSSADWQTVFEKRINGKKFFIISDFSGFQQQTQLESALYNQYPVFAQTEHYLIFDLRYPLPEKASITE
jgi:4-amino-4-deoxy-L-arabinose transferase-like glycosyltransferase